jgi:hypothetical protein
MRRLLGEGHQFGRRLQQLMYVSAASRNSYQKTVEPYPVCRSRKIMSMSSA